MRSKHEANEEILSALGRRGPNALNVLLESLEAEDDVHKHIIEKIRAGEGGYFNFFYYHCRFYHSQIFHYHYRI